MATAQTQPFLQSVLSNCPHPPEGGPSSVAPNARVESTPFRPPRAYTKRWAPIQISWLVPEAYAMKQVPSERVGKGIAWYGYVHTFTSFGIPRVLNESCLFTVIIIYRNYQIIKPGQTVQSQSINICFTLNQLYDKRIARLPSTRAIMISTPSLEKDRTQHCGLPSLTLQYSRMLRHALPPPSSGRLAQIGMY